MVESGDEAEDGEGKGDGDGMGMGVKLVQMQDRANAIDADLKLMPEPWKGDIGRYLCMWSKDESGNTSIQSHSMARGKVTGDPRYLLAGSWLLRIALSGTSPISSVSDFSVV